MKENISITPETKVGALLKEYPDLESTLINMAPAFEKLKNPVLRKTVARVANLKQVSEVSKVPLPVLIGKLRKAAGLPEMDQDGSDFDTEMENRPGWVKTENIIESLDARPLLAKGQHPVDQVMHSLDKIPDDKIFELKTPFIPSPLIDIAKKKGCRAWTEEVTDDLYKTYFSKSEK